MNDLIRSVVERVEKGGICGVILDVACNSVVIRYEYGEPTTEKEPLLKDPEELSWHTIRAKYTDGLVKSCSAINGTQAPISKCWNSWKRFWPVQFPICTMPAEKMTLSLIRW